MENDIVYVFVSFFKSGANIGLEVSSQAKVPYCKHETSFMPGVSFMYERSPENSVGFV